MAAEKSLSTSTAILLAGAMLSVAVFFGLRGRDPAPAPVAAPVTTAPGTGVTLGVPPGPGGPPSAPSGAVSGPAQEPVPVPSATAAPAADKAAVLAAATKQLEASRAAVVEKCVKPALAKQPNPPQIKLTFNIAFDAKGKQVMRGVSEDRPTSRAGVSSCAMDTIPELDVPAPGAPTQIELPWTLP